ncbi:asparagine synthase [Longilinea arvoryzae]|uniref:asparagine synthase (glutamine-hydrolyzing) n=1 Tax=Longilinea arvoryzae TaxID=360412 RepID=A0A0S7BG35_9CHLR|nr:asparagine synthase (glutamine-hydrolyzing) [Longilinea arvoryzae]GAP13446.1 asparagine synthase [Longilinea arvoryzae]
MCGITGIINLNEPEPIREETLRGMLGMLRHRGPDEFGIYRSPWAGLGSARLSILDLSGGQQPISNEDGSLWIVYNGEVFNYVELRPRLEALGHRFTTHTDTEVILHLYEEYGPDCLSQLNGQFALAIWDERERSLFLARDRMGIRPLYYALPGGQFLFGSEIKAMLAHPALTAEIDPAALAQAFTLWSVQPPASIFRGIQSLPPAHYLRLKDGRIEIKAYWSLDLSQEMDPDQPLAPALEEFKNLLIDSTLIRLRADVPVGAYLSGGLDSSLTTAIIRKYTQNHLETFSIAFSDPQFDESSYQLRMAETLGTHHHVVYATHEEIGRVFPQVIWHTETPILRTAPAPMYLLSGLVREHDMKVVITGEGADELLGGYDIFKEMLVRRFWARNPESEMRPMLLTRLYPDIAALNSPGRAYLKAFFKKDLSQTDSPFYSHSIRWGNGLRLLRFLQPQPLASLAEQAAAVPLPAGFDHWSALAKAQYLEMTTFLSPYLLSSQGDRMGMSHSVEGRFPFLDVRVVEFCNRLPAQWKMYGLTEKWFLRQVGRELLPEEIWRRVKRPYRAPIHRSFFNADAPEYIQRLLSAEALEESGLFNPIAVGQLARKAASGAALSEVDDMAVAGVLSTQLVYDQFVQHFSTRKASLTAADRVRVIDHTAEVHPL